MFLLLSYHFVFVHNYSYSINTIVCCPCSSRNPAQSQYLDARAVEYPLRGQRWVVRCTKGICLFIFYYYCRYCLSCLSRSGKRQCLIYLPHCCHEVLVEAVFCHILYNSTNTYIPPLSAVSAFTRLHTLSLCRSASSLANILLSKQTLFIVVSFLFSAIWCLK